jgi:hypothetical protein
MERIAMLFWPRSLNRFKTRTPSALKLHPWDIVVIIAFLQVKQVVWVAPAIGPACHAHGDLLLAEAQVERHV